MSSPTPEEIAFAYAERWIVFDPGQERSERTSIDELVELIRAAEVRGAERMRTAASEVVRDEGETHAVVGRPHIGFAFDQCAKRVDAIDAAAVAGDHLPGVGKMVKSEKRKKR